MNKQAAFIEWLGVFPPIMARSGNWFDKDVNKRDEKGRVKVMPILKSDVPAVVEIAGRLYVSHESEAADCERCVAADCWALCFKLPGCAFHVDGEETFLHWTEVVREGKKRGRGGAA